MTPTETPPKAKNGWGGARANSGGARANSGGARPGSGRPRKSKPDAIFPPVPQYAGKSSVALVRPYGVKLRYDATVGHITTGGSLTHFDRAWVYVAMLGDGRFKIGMSSNLPQRCKQLKATLYHAQPVNPAHARTAETLTLRMLGVQLGSSETVSRSVTEVLAALACAFAELRKVCRVDPMEAA